jgi:hypothetical protein
MRRRRSSLVGSRAEWIEIIIIRTMSQAQFCLLRSFGVCEWTDEQMNRWPKRLSLSALEQTGGNGQRTETRGR